MPLVLVLNLTEITLYATSCQQVQKGQANSGIVNHVSMKLSLSEGRPIVLEQESDDSDSEIFRVKRRSSAKVVHRNANDATSPNFEQQVCFWLPSCHPFMVLTVTVLTVTCTCLSSMHIYVHYTHIIVILKASILWLRL